MLSAVCRRNSCVEPIRSERASLTKSGHRISSKTAAVPSMQFKLVKRTLEIWEKEGWCGRGGGLSDAPGSRHCVKRARRETST